MQRHLSDDASSVGHSSEAPNLLRGLANLIEANYADAKDYAIAGGLTQRDLTVARIHAIADAVDQVEGHSVNGWDSTGSREWMVELCGLLGLPWDLKKERRAKSPYGTSESVD